jgi:hypothetical protein
MADTSAYKIGMTRDLFPKSILKAVRLSMYVVATLLVGFVGYSRLPKLSSGLDVTPSGSTPSHAREAPAPAVAVKQSDAVRPATRLIQTRPRKAQTIDQAAPAPVATPEPQETGSPAADPPSAAAQSETDVPAPPSLVGESSTPAQSWRATPAQDSGNPVKRAIKSVGHFLHLGHEKYQPEPSTPQPATAP